MSSHLCDGCQENQAVFGFVPISGGPSLILCEGCGKKALEGIPDEVDEMVTCGDCNVEYRCRCHPDCLGYPISLYQRLKVDREQRKEAMEWEK